MLRQDSFATKYYTYDWLTVVSLLLLRHYVKQFEPFQRFVLNGDPNLSYPLIVGMPEWQLYLISIGLPALCMALLRFFPTVHHVSKRGTMVHLLGLAVSLSTALLITDVLKKVAGRPRPNFFALCDWDGQTCQAPVDVINAARSSFPSGHASIAFSGLAYFSQFLVARFLIASAAAPYRPSRNQAFKLVVCIAPLLIAGAIAIFRTRDYWHHFDDVLAGAAIGLSCAYISHRLYFPSVWTTLALGPGSYYSDPDEGDEYQDVTFPRRSRAGSDFEDDETLPLNH